MALSRDGAAVADGVIHLAFNNISEITDFAAAVRQDLRAVETIGAALAGSGKPFVVTFGTLTLAMGRPLGRLGTEEDVPDFAVPRVAAENRRSRWPGARCDPRSCATHRPCRA